jgi:hypothetical protein
MVKKKNFRDWMDEDFEEDREVKFKKKDTKRYDKKKASIQKARRRKARDKFSHLE